MQHFSLYNILGIDKSASVESIRKAYKRRVLETHPDKLDPGASDKDKLYAEAQFQKVHEAFEILGDPQKRQAYDARLSLKRQSGGDLSDDLKKRMKERNEWAWKQVEQYRKRMDSLEERRRAEKLAQEKLERIVKEMVDSLNDAIPDWRERKQRVERMKAERESRGRRV